jgi:hypothetical protein
VFSCKIYKDYAKLRNTTTRNAAGSARLSGILACTSYGNNRIGKAYKSGNIKGKSENDGNQLSV